MAWANLFHRNYGAPRRREDNQKTQKKINILDTARLDRYVDGSYMKRIGVLSVIGEGMLVPHSNDSTT